MALWDMKADCRNLIKNAFACMIGKMSRLPADDQKVLTDFLNVLHSHVHLSFFSFFVLFKSGKATGRLGILPKFDNTSAGTFVYASKAMAWTHLRVQWSLWNPLPVDLKLRKQFSTLNDAFLYSASEWSPVCSKAWRNFIDINFPLKTD